jgi:hypothetical protein
VIKKTFKGCKNVPARSGAGAVIRIYGSVELEPEPKPKKFYGSVILAVATIA